jgi:hypothetical protein
MTRAHLVAAGALGGLLALPAQAQQAQQAQTQTMSFEQAAYTTCADAQEMSEQQRMDIGLFLVENAARHYGISLHDNDQTGVELGNLAIAGCTMFPNAYLFTILSSAVRAIATKQGATVPPR